jgi:hypothetical protein
MKKIITLVALMVAFVYATKAQDIPCGQLNPERIEGVDAQFANEANARGKNSGGGVRVIPVVVHVIASSATSPGNIDGTQVQAGIDVLNEAFSGIYGGVDTKIQFCLAATDRLIDPINSTVALTVNDAYVKSLLWEDQFQYYNVWVVEQLAQANGRIISGYTTYPKFLTQFSPLDGTLIPNLYWGNSGTGDDYADYDQGKTAVHEAGHWLNLYHVFQGSCDYDWNCGAEGDCCCDTPPMSDTLFKCRKRRNSCNTDTPDERDPVHNYMGYVVHDCQFEFTECQSARMNTCLDIMRNGAWFTAGQDCPPPRLGLPSNADRNLHVQAYPNPFSTNTTLKVEVIGKETPITIQVYDAQGRLVTQITDRQLLPTGQHEYQFEAPNPGIYLARVVSPWHTKSIRLVSVAR